MTSPVQLQYKTKDGAERIVLLPTIDIDAPDMLSVIAGVVVHQHDTIQQMTRRIESLEASPQDDIQWDGHLESTERNEPVAVAVPESNLVPGEHIESLE